MKLGILGGGQLAQMLTLAAIPLDISTLCIDPTAGVCASRVTEVMHASLDDQTALHEFAAQVDVITIETENIPTTTVDTLQQLKPVAPSLAALKVCQDRILEKQCCNELDIATTAFTDINSLADLQAAGEQLAYPFLVKTRRFGYDGKGQALLSVPTDCEAAWRTLGESPSIGEALVAFDRELSIIAVRRQNGDCAFYPLCENHHHQGILRLTQVPFDNFALQKQAEDIALRLLTHFNYVGVLTIELFQVGDQLLVNELAPRVHNSGHWSIEGADCSQFENHVRAICDLPLGSTQARGYSAMLNLISQVPTPSAVLEHPQAHCHFYGKAPRPGRKLGHVTLNCETKTDLHTQLTTLQTLQGIHYE